MKKWFLVLACVVGLSGCLQSTVPTQTLPEITFQHLAPIALNVAQIDVVDQRQSTLTGEHVEHLFPTAPKTALNNWVRDRLLATGSSGVARFTILDASAVEEKLTKKTGIKGMFTNDQSERYTVNVDSRLDIFDANSNLVAQALANASRFVTVAEDATLLEREKAWFKLVEKTMQDFDEKMAAGIQK